MRDRLMFNRSLFCGYVKLFLPSNFNSLVFGSSWEFLLRVCSGILISSSIKKQTQKASLLVCKELDRNSVEQWMFGLQGACKRLPNRVDTLHRRRKSVILLPFQWIKSWKFWRSWLSQSSISCSSRWRNAKLLELPDQTHDHTSLCTARCKIVW